MTDLDTRAPTTATQRNPYELFLWIAGLAVFALGVLLAGVAARAESEFHAGNIDESLLVPGLGEAGLALIQWGVLLFVAWVIVRGVRWRR